MDKIIILTCIILSLFACSKDYSDDAEYSDQNDEYWEQVAETDRQLATVYEQFARSEAQQDMLKSCFAGRKLS